MKLTEKKRIVVKVGTSTLKKVLVWQNWMQLLIWRTPCRSMRKQNRQINLLCWQI